MLSIGRFFGIRKCRYVLKKCSDRSVWFGQKQWNVSGKACRSSRMSSSCSRVVPVRQWPITNSGSFGTRVESILSPYSPSCTHRRQVWTNVEHETMSAMYQYGGSTANRFAANSRSQGK
jgi:hypothetical protein